MDDADEIWNRATRGGGNAPREGDIALAASLAFHGLAMNGGVLHAFEVLSEEELSRARNGFVWLALPEVARFMEDTAQQIGDTDMEDEDAADALEESADDSYEHALPSDQALEDAFRRQLAERPEAFHPA
ncbi:hypothetical protein ABEG17_00290 [Pedococcus sp. KACC 23699]|uniref:DUF4375 domain-containing protein n=1 Tax=Pedococcus sp. KACC 23699 TaxID=3149228 RepID=A0AAU7JS68_9MICO